MAGSMVAMVPSGLFLLTTITFASSVVKLAKHQTLVQELYSIETLARVDMVCLDKTGTITDGSMKVESFVWIEEETEPESEIDLPIEETVPINPLRNSVDIYTIIASMNYALKDTNQTAEALKKYFGSKRKLRARTTLPFASENKYSAVMFDEGTYAIGAPELVVKGHYMAIRKQVEKYARQGKRVLLFAKAKAIEDKKIVGSVEPIALLLLNDTIRQSAKATLDEFQAAGVSIKVISGDNALTVSEVASRAGVPNAKKYLSLEKISDDKLIEIADDYTVFGRVTPSQKQLLIEAFQSQKHRVAMSGDGVKAILALKTADCSVAIASGSEAARNISHLVLLDNDFASLPKVVKQGRQIVNNMQNAAVLYLVKTMYTILLTLIVLLTANIYPFEPIQMFVIETFIIGIPSFFIALEPNEKRFEGSFLWNVFKNVIPGTLLVIANLIGVYVFASQWPSITQGEISTVGIVAATFAYLLVLVNVSSPLNKRRSIIEISAALIAALCFLVMGERFFKHSTMSIPSILLLMLLMQSTYLIMSIFKKQLIKFWV
jgi:cation-transporting ATPase E